MPLTSSTPTSSPDNVTAAILLLMAISTSVVETTIIRWLGGDTTVWQAVLFRGLGQVIVVVGWMIWRGAWPNLRSDYPWLHVARGAVSVVGWTLFYWMFQNLEVALATLLTFASSLFVVLLAGPVLGERVRLATWMATLVGFAGIFIASGVGTMAFHSGVIVGLVAAVFSAAIVFLTRTLAQTEDTLTTMIFIGAFVLVFAIPAAWWTWVPLGIGHMLLMLLAGVLGGFSMLLMIEAYGRGEAAVLAPIPYVRLALAIAIGYVLFAEVPSLNMIIGSCIVVASALWSIRHERQRRAGQS